MTPYSQHFQPKPQTGELVGMLIPISKSIIAKQKCLHVGLTPVSKAIRVRHTNILLVSHISITNEPSTRRRSLQSCVYGRKLDRDTQAEDLIGGAYDCKMLIRHVTFHLHVLTISFLLP